MLIRNRTKQGCLKRLGNEKGFALVLTLFALVILLTLGGVFILRSINEWHTANRERRISQAFYNAEAGAERGLLKIDELINTYMMNTINVTHPQTVSTRASQYVKAGDGLGFLILTVKDGGVALLTLSGSEAVYTEPLTNFNGGNYTYTIVIQEKADPITVSTDMWDFPFFYRIQASGRSSSVTRRVLLAGDFSVRVQRDNFAKFALFTDHHTTPSGGIVWFTDQTNFAGPLHTNERYSFAFNPSGIFEGEVTQHFDKARFYNNGASFTADQDTNPGIDVPIFHDAFKRGVGEIVLSSSVQQQDLYNQARGGDVTVGNGIFLTNDGTNLTGGIFVRGNASIQMGVDAQDNAVYTITEGVTTKVITVDIPNNRTTVQTLGGSAPTVHYTGLPDGMDDLGTIIYVDGGVTSLSGTVQRNTEVTVSAQTDINITNHIRYTEYTSAVGNPGDINYVPPNADGTKNLLGILAWGGNVRVSPGAPNNLDVHGVVMARNGVFTVDDYNNQGVGARGTCTMLGGVITQFYGPFGLYDGITGNLLAGYGRNFAYDGRMLIGKSPPYFPSMKTFIAFTNDITDKVAFQEGGF